MVRVTESTGDCDYQTRIFNDLCDLVVGLIKPPLCSPAARGRRSQVTPAAFASLMLGVSMALILCGSVTFLIGFILMPWVLAIVMAVYFVGIVSNLSVFWRAMLCPSSSTKEATGQPFFSKFPVF